MKLPHIPRLRLRASCLFLFPIASITAQPLRYLRASNCNCTVATYSNSSSVEWNGRCTNGYCDGYGTVKYYDPNGNYDGCYIGNVSQGILTGFGTKYNADGSILYRGNFKENVHLDLAPYFALKGQLGDLVIDSLLRGGIHRHCDIVKGVFSPDGDMQEVRFRITCNGQWVPDNHYDCTLVFSNQAPYARMVDVNDNAQAMLALTFIYYANRLSNWMQEQSRNKQQ
jgi:hypothetical protein